MLCHMFWLICTSVLVYVSAYNTENIEYYSPQVYAYSRTYMCYGDNFTVYSVPENIRLNRTRCGIYIHKKEFKEPPRIIYTEANKKGLYTVMVGEAVKDFETGWFYLLWLLVNIKGKDLIIGNLEDADEFMRKYNMMTDDTSKLLFMFLIMRVEF
uniref:Lipocalin/cytosolic fatty-acid binding domain-containing protein n=1 Tax=Clastoptera arizonana TaxID=38151 RepID=A0A1B6CUV1_9HEMI